MGSPIGDLEMAYIQHPSVINDRIVVRLNLPSQGIKQVLEVSTSLPLSPLEEGYDEKAFADLAEAVRDAMIRTGVDEAAIFNA